MEQFGLNEHERKILPTFQTLLSNNIPKEEIINWMIASTTEPQGSQADINWMKIAVQLDSKTLIDAVFSNENVSEDHVNAAIKFGATKTTSPKLGTLDRIAIKMVESEYEVKHAQQSPNSNLPDSMKKYATLSTFEYLQERVKDMFTKKSVTQNKIAELREKFEDAQTNQVKIKLN